MVISEIRGQYKAQNLSTVEVILVFLKLWPLKVTGETFNHIINLHFNFHLKCCHHVPFDSLTAFTCYMSSDT